VRFRDTIVFLFNTASGIIFLVLAITFIPVFWLFVAIPILTVLTVGLEFRKTRHEILEGKRGAILPEIESLWRMGGFLMYIFIYIAIYVRPDFLFYAIIFSIFFLVDTFDVLGKVLARVSMRNHV